MFRQTRPLQTLQPLPPESSWADDARIRELATGLSRWLPVAAWNATAERAKFLGRLARDASPASSGIITVSGTNRSRRRLTGSSQHLSLLAQPAVRPVAPIRPYHGACCKCYSAEQQEKEYTFASLPAPAPERRTKACCPCIEEACPCDAFADDAARRVQCRELLARRRPPCFCPAWSIKASDRFERITAGMALGAGSTSNLEPRSDLDRTSTST
jgi:hypothetical protein